MKSNLFFLALAASLAFASCAEKASGPVVTETRDLTSFSRLVVNTSGRVEITVGPETRAEITCEQSVLPLLKTEVSGGRLLVDFSKSVRDLETLVVRITVPSLDRVDLNGSADVVCEGLLKGQSIDLNLLGSGDLVFPSLDFTTIDASVHGSGDLEIGGKAIELASEIFGSGNLAALEMRAEKAHVDNSGSGNATVSAVSDLWAKITGSGNISYRGEPKIEQTMSGSGKLIKL